MKAPMGSIDMRNYDVSVRRIALSPVSACDLKADPYDLA